jgi:uridine kinase
LKTSKNSNYIIGVTGGSASGKTYVLEEISRNFNGEVTIISMDDYYHPVHIQKRDHNDQVNFDLPEAIDRQQLLYDLQKLLNGEIVYRSEYSFNNPAHTPKLKEFLPSPVIVIEGLFIFFYEEIKKLLDLKVYIEARDDIMLNRRLMRDERLRGIKPETILYQWNFHVYPAFKKYLLPYKDEADVIITNNNSCIKGLQLLLDHIKSVTYGK